MMKVSEELLNDSVFDLESYIAKEFSRRIGTKEEDAFFNGDGSGKPLGVLVDNGGAQVSMTAAAPTAVTLAKSWICCIASRLLTANAPCS